MTKGRKSRIVGTPPDNYVPELRDRVGNQVNVPKGVNLLKFVPSQKRTTKR